MELKAYFAPVLKYWWLLVLAGMVSSVSSFLVVRQQAPIFQTRTTLVVGRAVYEANPTSNDLWLNQQLAAYYADVAQRAPVRNATMEALGLEWLPNYFARPIPNSQFIEIAVTDSVPIRAQAVANELANQLILQSPTSPQNREQDQQSFVNRQLSNLEIEITKTEEEIVKKEDELTNLISAREIANAQGEVKSLRDKLSSLQSNYASLLANTDRGAVNTLTVIEPAVLPVFPIGPNKNMTVILSTVIAMGIAVGAAYLLEFVDDTLKSPEEITRLLNLPVIGYLTEMGKGQNEAAYVAKKPRSIVAEAFRALRVNLDFVGVDEPLKTILVTSSGVSEGKTSVATNLAIVMAQAGKKVILLDADLRRPNVHRSLELPNTKGLSDVFRGNVELQELPLAWTESNLSVITAGSIPPNPTDLLGSKRMDAILDQLAQEVDMVVIDGPPLLVSDAAVLAAKVNGVLLVIRHGYTRKGAIKAALEQLHRTGARVVGIALNRLPRTSEGYYGRYHYYNSYYGPGDEGDEGSTLAARNGKVRLPGFLKRTRASVPDTKKIDQPGKESSIAGKHPAE